VEYLSQKRFVIYGLGGSGKTELALKYAEDHLQNFWGVFFVDGSSRKNAAGSYLEIATIAGVEPHEKAARNWLTTRALPWLLIIDNVDDDEVRLEELLPMGTKGRILITSRNPAHKSWGTVGEKYLELLPMESEEANELILKAAEEPSPWAKSVKDSASSICTALGFLPLALVHAGRAIFFRLCPWHGYLSFYDRHWQRIRRERHHQRRRSFSRERMASNDVDDNMNVFSSYEILYESLSSSETQRFQDAVELLHVFSYLHFQNIRLDIFIKAAINPMKEAKNMEKDVREAEELQKGLAKLRRRTWSTWIREQVLRVGQYLDTPPPLPAALKNLDPGLSESNVENEVHDRLCMALEVLVSRSLITNSDRLENRYCMHRLVHKWVRERPDISTSQQALWCQVASTVLARCILFPPLGEEEHERSMRRELLPHIIEVQKCQKVIRDRLIENRAGRKLYWPVTDTEFGKLQAIEAARFSRVYLECGLFNIAHQLQSKVRTFVIERLGEEHMISIRITLFLTVTLYNLSRASDATQLQRRVYDVCLKSLGQHHPLTLKVTDSLASSLCFQGRWSESLTLHERAIEGMTVVFGKAHENTLLAMNNLAKLYERYMEFEKCVELHRVAWEGMKERLGELHFDTLLCLEDLATSSLRLGGEYLLKAHDMMTFVLERRREMLVKEHPYILLAIANLGRVKSALGQHDEAARIMRDALNIAERNLGEDHFGVLYGKTQYAQVLVHLGRYEEAEKMFHNVVEKPQYRKATNEDGEHPDRIIALWYLTGCLEKQGKFRDALQVCEGLMESLREIGGNGLGTRHKFASILREEIEKLEGKIAEDSKQITDADLVATKDFGRGI
jgi:tetratricopeptide (TPR) repeat protein